MRILTWNCNGALRKKFNSLIELDADIYVIQECEDPKKTDNVEYINWSINHVWVGDSKNKGLGVFAKKDINIKKLDWSDNYENHRVKYFLPVLINDNQKLLAVWAHKNNSPTFGYIGQIWKYLKINKDNLTNTIIAGDFNSNSIWDAWDRWWNHSDVMREFSEIGLESAYHMYHNEVLGKETRPTFYLQRNLNKSYHIDYIITNKEVIKEVKEFKILEQEKWLELSDHLPLLIDY